MKFVSKNILLCCHNLSAVHKLNRRPRAVLFVRLDRRFPRQRKVSTTLLSSAKNPMRLSASNNHLLENYIKLQNKKHQILPNTSNWPCYEEIQNIANVMRDFPHSFKRDVNTGRLENNSGYRSKTPIFADNFSLFWTSKIKETYERIRDFPVNMFWAPIQNNLALDVLGNTRISEMGKDTSISWFASRSPHSGVERTRRPGGKIGRLNKTTAEYLALYNKLQKSRLEELKRKFRDIKIQMEREEAERISKYSELPPGPLKKSIEPLGSLKFEKTEASAAATRKSNEMLRSLSSTAMITSPKKDDTLEGKTLAEEKE